MTTLTSAPPVSADVPRTDSRFAGTTPAKTRSIHKRITIAIILVVLIPVAWTLISKGGAAVSTVATDRLVVQPKTFSVSLKEKGELKAVKSTDVKCEVEGRSTIISLIPEGTAVKGGDLLVELASDEIDNKIQTEELKEANAITAFERAKTELEIQRDLNASNIRKANLEIELKQLELERYEKGDWVQRLKDATIAIEQAKITLERRQQDYAASKELYAKKYTTQTEYEEAEFNFKKAEWDLEKARKAMEVLETYTHKAELSKKRADFEEATKEADRVKKNAEAEEVKKIRDLEGREKELKLTQDQLAKFRNQKEKCRIYAPTQGFVVYYGGGGGMRFFSDDRQIKEGAEVFERQVIMQLPDTSSMMATVRIHEAKTNKLSEGQRAMVTVEGIPGRQFPGSVTKIAVLADSQSGWLNPDLKEYETEITLDPTDYPLKPGVTAHAEIMVSTVEEGLAVPVQSVYSKGGKRYVFKDDGGDPEYIEVSLGGVSDDWAEVTSGLSAGDTILLALSDELKRKLPDGQPMSPFKGMPGGAQPVKADAGQAGAASSGATSSSPSGGDGNRRRGPNSGSRPSGQSRSGSQKGS